MATSISVRYTACGARATRWTLGVHGMRTRPMRAVLSAPGIRTGLAAMVAMLAIPASSAQALHDKLAALGTNLITDGPGQTLLGKQTELPDSAVPMAKRIGPVTAATATGKTGKTARRTDKIPSDETSGLGLYAATPNLLGVLGGKVCSGAFLGPATQNYPTVVLGSVAAARLGIDHVDPAKPPQVWICGQWFTVIGVLGPMPLAPEIERSVLVGWNAASEYRGFRRASDHRVCPRR
jgi:putative ABC transport system permease protein